MAETHHIAASAIGRLSMVPPAVWIVSGAPGEYRSAVATALLEGLERGVHVSGDALAAAIVGGRVLPGEEPEAESERQVELSIRNQCLLARSYAEAGFTPVLEYAVLTRHHVDAYRHYLAGGRLRLVVAVDDGDASEAAELARRELSGLGMWVGDSSGADGASILEGEDAAAID
jgi:hypothetical protein